jgi:outer membrane protein OmpA-like peptidoglycan-associated protein
MTDRPRKTLGLMAALGIAFAASPLAALELSFPGKASQTVTQREEGASFRLPTGPFAKGTLPTLLTEGRLEQSAFRITDGPRSTLDLMRPIREQLLAGGFHLLFECETESCGGFDFRYGINILPEPDMHVDLGDFRFLTAQRGAESLALMVSRAGAIGFVQVSYLGGDGALTAESTAASSKADLSAPKPAPPPSPATPGDLIAVMETGQSAVLEDLVFGSGSSALQEADYASLSLLAGWLKADAAREVVLVGHTDASGSLEGNVRLSQLRAESVRQALLFSGGITPEQVAAEGVGYLAPRAGNLTEEGRRKNRRVEVMVTSTELLTP